MFVQTFRESPGYRRHRGPARISLAQENKEETKMSSLKQFEYAEIIVETGVPEEEKSDSELKTFLLSLLSYDLEQQILKRLTLTL